MRGLTVLWVTPLIATLMTSGLPAAIQAACLPAEQLTGGCAAVDAGTDGEQVDLRGEVTSPGSSAGEPAAGSDESGGSGEEGEPEGNVPSGTLPTPQNAVPKPPLRWDWTVADAPDVSLRDLASFRPQAGTQAGEPAGWGIVGLDTNFYAESAAHVLEGELLGRPASVRFTPVAWHWSYGDGASASTLTPGSPWGSAAEEFEPTTTSHRYAAPGTYAVEVAVEFAAEYRFADLPWNALDGTVAAETLPISMRIGTADTVLVERGCLSLSAPGC
jgi:hypothetical protein